jgi:hypothetical protein
LVSNLLRCVSFVVIDFVHLARFSFNERCVSPNLKNLLSMTQIRSFLMSVVRDTLWE